MKRVREKLKTLIPEIIYVIVLLAVIILGAIILEKYGDHPVRELPAWLHWIIRR